MQPEVRRVDAPACQVGESPVWHAGEQAWYWTDIPARTVWRLDAASGRVASWAAPEMVACMAPRAAGGLVAGMESGIFRLELQAGGEVVAERLAAPPAAELTAGMRFNDGRCDRQGRFWSGTMFMDMAAARADGRLYRYDGQGLSQPLVAGLLTQNGLAWSPDGRTMYLSDSHPQRQLVWAFDYDLDDGVPSNRRLFVDMNHYPGRPDGATVDADGCYWLAANDAGLLLRFTPDGRLERRIALPMAKPSMPCFGGAGLDTLLVTSINPAHPDQPDAAAGATVMLVPGVQGLLDTPFAF
ncbi:SMP-30/gluconolactonase/LRE family protein [Massilia phyllosphaerae]|uniref:SMP-30/gluconolactonase/LRE family protein n=1 Tax=Massilia phyllosphaerae TaxID=3106034 RepID=UPI002B1CC8C9|nr:SMP-30/gluconolactonase/LRE family protein [Massilia sp. SGZ-792]